MYETISRLSNENLSVDDSLGQTARGECNVLGSLCFSAESTKRSEGLLPCLNVHLPRLDRSDPVYEIWRVVGEPTSGQRGDVCYRHDEEFVFGVIVLPENRFEPEAGKTPLQLATGSAYRQVFTLLDALSFPHPLRFWNYLPSINAHSHGMERYQQFNIGRQEAFLAHGRDVQVDPPAACALGMKQGSLGVAFLAGRARPKSIENPRQISAFQYPPQYGPRSPTFSRACLVSTSHGALLLISGTASIVGHASLHSGDVGAQTRESVANIAAVVAEANRVSSCGRFDLSTLSYRVYLRHPGDLERVRAELAHCVGESLKAVYLQADICRLELLLEIEATASLSPGTRN